MLKKIFSIMGFRLGGFLGLALVIIIHSSALADMGYLTTYSHHFPQGEIEFMIMTDFTSPAKIKREEGQGNYLSQMWELEYVPTDRLALELMAEGFWDVESGEMKFTGMRYETRYNPFTVKLPLNPTLYVEYEDLDPATRYKMEVSGWRHAPYGESGGAEPARESILESRLILSEDVGPLNLAFNWINESDLFSGTTAFGYSAGILRLLGQAGGHHDHSAMSEGWIKPMSLGLELVGALGDSRVFGLVPARQEHYLSPSVTFHADGTMISLGAMLGLTEVSDNLLRVNCGWNL